MFKQEDIKILLHTMNEMILPYLEDKIEKNNDKSIIKTVVNIVKEILSRFRSIIPSNNKLNFKDIILFHYKLENISEDILDDLKNTMKRIIKLTDYIHDKVMADDTLKRNDDIIYCLGSVYKQTIAAKYLQSKKFIFNDNPIIYSPLDLIYQKRLWTCYNTSMSYLTDKIIYYHRSSFEQSDELFMHSLKRTYEYDELYFMIPIVQMNTKLGKGLKFTKYYPENQEFHESKIEQALKNIIMYVERIIPQEEIDPIDEDMLIGN